MSVISHGCHIEATRYYLIKKFMRPLDIRLWRESAGFTQAVAAAFFGRSINAYRRMERRQGMGFAIWLSGMVVYGRTVRRWSGRCCHYLFSLKRRGYAIQDGMFLSHEEVAQWRREIVGAAS